MSAPTQTSKHSESLSPLTRIKLALTQAAMLRGAKLDPETISLYSARLAREPFDDVIAALEKLGEMPREDFEPALPEMGALLAMVRSAGIARANREMAAKDLEHIAWQCMSFPGHTCGDYFPKERKRHLETVYCQAPSRRAGASKGEICGGNMRVIFRGEAA